MDIENVFFNKCLIFLYTLKEEQKKKNFSSIVCFGL